MNTTLVDPITLGEPIPYCAYCDKVGHDIEEYQEACWADLNIIPDDDGNPIEVDPSIQPTDEQIDEWIRWNEGTYNPENGHFACTLCYIRIGQPSSPRGWTAP